MKAFLSIILAVAVSISTALAKHGGHGGHRGHGGYHGKHGKHFSSVSPRGGRNFSRSGWKFSRSKSGKYRNWGGRNWRGRNWSGDWGSGGYWSGGNRFIFMGGGYPYYWNWYPYWGWRYPYSVLQLLSLVFVPLRQLFRIKTAILWALTPIAVIEVKPRKWRCASLNHRALNPCSCRRIRQSAMRKPALDFVRARYAFSIRLARLSVIAFDDANLRL